MIFVLEVKKPIIHVLSEVMKRKTVDSCCFIISKCYNFHVLFCSEYHQSNVKTICYLICHYSVCVIYDLSKAGRST